jgi:hypothetical protein
VKIVSRDASRRRVGPGDRTRRRLTALVRVIAAHNTRISPPLNLSSISERLRWWPHRRRFTVFPFYRRPDYGSASRLETCSLGIVFPRFRSQAGHAGCSSRE